MIRYIEDIACHILDIPELNKLRVEQNSFRVNKNDAIIRRRYFDSMNSFFEWYISYCATILKAKKYQDTQISEWVFRLDFKSKSHLKEYLIKTIYISRDYVEHLKNSVTETNVHRYASTVTSLEIDLEWLISVFEVECRKTTEKISLNSGRRKELSPTDIYSAARTLFDIEVFNSIEELYLRDLKPVVMFQIRQLLEVFGKNLLGYYSISDNEGNSVKKFTQIAWDFIKDEVKKPESRIELPFDIHMIVSINNWSNNFVHTTYIYSGYIQFFALKALSVLFVSKTKGIKVYNGQVVSKYNFADIKIKEYNSLKLDFENYLEKMMPNIVIDWMHVDSVGAYILSL